MPAQMPCQDGAEQGGSAEEQEHTITQPPEPGWRRPWDGRDQPSEPEPSWGQPPAQPEPSWGQPPAQEGGGPPPVPLGGGPPGVQSPRIGRGSGLVPLRPLTIGEIYDGAIRAIRGNPRTMAGFAAVVVAVFSLLTLLPQAAALTQLAASGVFDDDFAQTATLSDLKQVLGSTGLTLALAVFEYVVGTALVSSLLVIAVDAAVRGRAISPRELLARGRRRIPAVLGLSLVIIVIAPLVTVLCLLPGVLLAIASPGLGLAAGLLVLGLVVAVVLTAMLILSRWAVAAPVLLLEDTTIRTALRRSARLVKGSAWRVFGISLLTAIIVAIIRQIFQVPFGFIADLAGPQAGTGSFSQTVVQLLILNAGSIVAGAICLPFSGGVSALLYLDLRIRREGLDVELLRPEQPR